MNTFAEAERLIRMRGNHGNAEYERQCEAWLAGIAALRAAVRIGHMKDAERLALGPDGAAFLESLLAAPGAFGLSAGDFSAADDQYWPQEPTADDPQPGRPQAAAVHGVPAPVASSEGVAEPPPKPLTRSQKLAAAGFTRRPTWRSLPPDEEPQAEPAQPVAPDISDFQLEQLFDAVHEHGEFGREFRERARFILAATPTEPAPATDLQHLRDVIAQARPMGDIVHRLRKSIAQLRTGDTGSAAGRGVGLDDYIALLRLLVLMQQADAAIDATEEPT